MDPGQAWRDVTLIAVLAVVVAAALSVDMGYDILAAGLVSLVVLTVYVYVIYKRYHVEVVPESDIALFDDPDDLRILCRIYGLYPGGNELQLRKRLIEFVRGNKGRAFTWVAPRGVLTFGAAFELTTAEAPPPARARSDGQLIGGRPRSAARLSKIRTCPVCDSRVSFGRKTCPDCGADLEFYVALSETKVGKRLLSQKNVAVRRKLRYGVQTLGEK